MKKYKNIMLGIFITLLVIALCGLETTLNNADNYLQTQKAELYKAYIDDCIEEEEFNNLLDTLYEYYEDNKVYEFNTADRITALNEPV